MWRRLEILLETHAEAEERYLYPQLLRVGMGAADAEGVDDEVKDALKAAKGVPPEDKDPDEYVAHPPAEAS